jgi:predicted amidohydrolase YtcJ
MIFLAFLLEKIRDIQVLLTVVNGKEVYTRKN